MNDDTQQAVAFLRRLGARGRAWQRANRWKSVRDTLTFGAEAIGRLEYVGFDMPWYYGHFHPLPAFETHRAIFDRLETVLRQSDDHTVPDADLDSLDAERDELMGRIDSVVRVVRGDGKARSVRDFKIKEGQFEYKPW